MRHALMSRYQDNAFDVNRIQLYTSDITRMHDVKSLHPSLVFTRSL